MKLPRRALSNEDLLKYVKLLKIPHFRGIFMRDTLPSTIHSVEAGIVNLDSDSGRGTHWTAYVKDGYNIKYFDSFGNLKPPLELITYFKSGRKPIQIKYNYDRYQSMNAFNCGHLCLKFLYNNST